ncbi:MAG: hypothetical protein IKS23_04260 [Alphaproteobacteria bacterium]|nr:hypothetical protein [Alphaproteobacteria bacterium]
MENQEKISNILEELRKYRVDVKNFGAETNRVEIEAENVSVSEPNWFVSEQGKGKVLQGSDMKSLIKIKAVGNGSLRLVFHGPDRRFEGKRYATWIDYKSIKINGEEILSLPVATWHDKLYRYETEVKDGQEIILEVEQQYHKYSEDELKDVLEKLYQNDEVLAKNINEITKEILKVTGRYSITQMSKYPFITADCFIPIGEACRVAYYMRKHQLRYCSLPFDWFGQCKLSFMIKSIVEGIDDWFSEYEVDPAKANKKCHYVYDTKNEFSAQHDFPLSETVEEHMPEFRKKYTRRLNRLIEILKRSNSICFVCNNRGGGAHDFYLFVKKIKELFPNNTYKLLHVHHNDEEKEIAEYKFDDEITIYNVEAYDIHKNGNNRSNPMFWIGNEDLWGEICNHLSLSDEVKRKLENGKSGRTSHLIDTEKKMADKYLEILEIKKSYPSADKVRVSFVCKSDLIERFVLWYELDKEYDDFVVDDRCDAAVVAFLITAMRGGIERISSKYPISEKLYYNLKYQAIPQMAYCNPGVSQIKLDMPTTKVTWHGLLNASGMSRGVDSFATYVEYFKECELDEYRLNAFTYFKVGAHHGHDAKLGHGPETKQELYLNQLTKTKEFCDKNNFKLIAVTSNLDEILGMLGEKGFDRTHTCRNCSAVMLLQKLIRRYYYSSSYQLSEFKLDINLPMAHYDRWLLPLLSTGSTEFYESNQNWSRLDKVKKIAQCEECYDYLQVCWMKSENCGQCGKCKRTLLELDCLGEDVLNAFAKSFDLEDYKKNHRKQWFEDVINQKGGTHGEAQYYEEIFMSACVHHPEVLGDMLPTKNPNIHKVVAKDKVNIRALPSMLSNVFEAASKGDTFTYLGECGAWVGVQNEKYQKAYVKKSFVDLIE